MCPTPALSSSVALSRDALVAALRSAPRQRLLDAAASLLAGIERDARRGRSVLSELLGRRGSCEVWEHYPARDAIDLRSGYRFYYHAHAQNARGEHGHFHVFAQVPERPGQPDYTHLVGISVDSRGFPLRVFTTNQWVTAERWGSAAQVLRAIERMDLTQARPTRVARWVQDTTRLFTPQIAAALQRRDARIAQRAARIGVDAARNDRRTHVVSQCRVDLAAQFRHLEAAGIA